MRRARPAPASAPVPTPNGFTLVELMVALFIFALLAVSGVVLLCGSVDSQAAVELRLTDMRAVQRLASLLDNDGIQAVSRPVRDENGNAVPAFAGGQGPALIAFVRAGAAPLDASPRGDLQRVGYVLDQGRLERLSWPQLDGSAVASRTILLRDVSAVSARFRAQDGSWTDSWQPQTAEDMPRAVELTIRRKGGAPLTIRALIGPQTRPKPPEPAEGTLG